MKTEDIFCKLFGFSKNTYYSWKREKKPVIELLNKYFTKEELIEYIENNEISNMKLLEDFKKKEASYIDDFFSILTLLYKKDNLDAKDIMECKSKYLDTFANYLSTSNNINKESFIDFMLSLENAPAIQEELQTLLSVILQIDDGSNFIIEREKKTDFISLADIKKSSIDKQAFYVFWIFWVSVKYPALTTKELNILVFDENRMIKNELDLIIKNLVLS